MNPAEYQKLAERTECDEMKALGRMVDPRRGLQPFQQLFTDLLPIRTNHGVLGLVTEVGELADVLKKFVYYGKQPNLSHIVEELGDCLWYIALLCNALGVDMGQVMAANIAKLQARYPDKYTDDKAINRDLFEEVTALNKTMAGQGGPSPMAQAVNVDPEALRRAIKEYADGLQKSLPTAICELKGRAEAFGLRVAEVMKEYKAILAEQGCTPFFDADGLLTGANELVDYLHGEAKSAEPVPPGTEQFDPLV